MDANVPDNPVPTTIRQVAGVMTGTSIDGIDAALVRIEGRGLDMKAAVVSSTSMPLDPLTESLRNAAQQAPKTAGEFAKLAWEFGLRHVEILKSLGKPGEPFDLICVHGQTIFHQPPYSWQLLNPAPIANEFGCPVVFDLRQADLAAGGQGAPITPIADWILFRDPGKSRAIVNLGGFCNVTILPQSQPTPSSRAGASSPLSATSELEQLQGFDICACNQLLDSVARTALGVSFDEGGCIAASGTPNTTAVEKLSGKFGHHSSQRRSLGTGDEIGEWVEEFRGELSPADLAASAAQAVANQIAGVLRERDVHEAILAGGGARNHTLVKKIADRFNSTMKLSDELGVPIEAREAMCFAILGALCADGVPITMPQVTGCSAPAPISGVWCLPRGPGR